MKRKPLLIVGSTLVALAVSVTASAQAGGGMGSPQAPPAGTSGQAPRAWFGGGFGAVSQDLTGSVTIGGGQFRREFVGLFAGEPATTSDIRNVGGSLQYGLTGSRATLAVSGSSSAGFFPAVSDQAVVSHRGQVSGTIQMSSRTSLRGTQGVYYEPTLARYLRNILDPGAGLSGGFLPPDLDVGIPDDRALSYVTSVGVGHQFSSRSRISADYSHLRSDYGSARGVQVSDRAGARITHQIARGLGLRLGYDYVTRQNNLATDDRRLEQHRWDAGIDFNRALSLSLSRQTTLTFDMGTSLARTNDHTRLYLTGNARLDHSMGRSWQTGLFYSRDIRFVEGLSELVESDRFGADLAGSLSRRVSLGSSAIYTRGRVGLGDGGNPYDALRGSAGMSITVSRSVGVSVNYGYYRSYFERDDFLLSPSLRDFGRHAAGVTVGFYGLVSIGAQYSTYRTTVSRDQSVTASVSLFAPLYSRARRPDAAR